MVPLASRCFQSGSYEAFRLLTPLVPERTARLGEAFVFTCRAMAESTADTAGAEAGS